MRLLTREKEMELDEFLRFPPWYSWRRWLVRRGLRPAVQSALLDLRNAKSNINSLMQRLGTVERLENEKLQAVRKLAEEVEANATLRERLAKAEKDASAMFEELGQMEKQRDQAVAEKGRFTEQARQQAERADKAEAALAAIRNSADRALGAAA